MPRDISEADLSEAHRHCTLHFHEISKSERCGCFYCLEIFEHTEITEWLNDRNVGLGTTGRTALCPRCGIDSVIGSASGYPITPEFLGAMRRRWFDNS